MRAELASGLEALGVQCDDQVAGRLLRFVNLLCKWNKTYNLTAIREPGRMIGLHLLDSLAALPYLKGKRIMDIGTGAGLPGIPLALCCPDKRFWLLDSSAKKTRFVRQAVLELGLQNVEVVHARIEDFQSDAGFDTIITRAFASVADILHCSGRLLATGGAVLALKGRVPADELDTLSGWTAAVFPLNVPGVAGERHLLRLTLVGQGLGAGPV